MDGGLSFIILLLLIPRITLFVTMSTGAMVSSYVIAHEFTGLGGILVTIVFMLVIWTGWLLAPRIVIALLACSLYFDTNPVLCAGSLMLAYISYEFNRCSSEYCG